MMELSLNDYHCFLLLLLEIGLHPFGNGLRPADEDDSVGQTKDRIAVLDTFSPDDPFRMRLHVASQYSRRFRTPLLNFDRPFNPSINAQSQLSSF